MKITNKYDKNYYNYKNQEVYKKEDFDIETINTDFKYKTQTLIIKGRLPGMNEVVDMNRRSKYTGHAMKKKHDKIIISAIKKQKIKKLTHKADFDIIFYENSRRRDKDNINAGDKYIFDGLQKAKIMPDDGWQEVGFIKHYYLVDKENPRIEIRIKERVGIVKK